MCIDGELRLEGRSDRWTQRLPAGEHTVLLEYLPPPLVDTFRLDTTFTVSPNDTVFIRAGNLNFQPTDAFDRENLCAGGAT